LLTNIRLGDRCRSFHNDDRSSNTGVVANRKVDLIHAHPFGELLRWSAQAKFRRLPRFTPYFHIVPPDTRGACHGFGRRFLGSETTGQNGSPVHSML